MEFKWMVYRRQDGVNSPKYPIGLFALPYHAEEFIRNETDRYDWSGYSWFYEELPEAIRVNIT